jgi:dTDP-4-dehydrorhamnose reductase
MKKHRILILGGSGFIGHKLYKELSPYIDTYATFCHNQSFEDNHRFFAFDASEDDIVTILDEINPTQIISLLRGPYAHLVVIHKHIIEWLTHHKTQIIFMSSANVFDAYTQFPNYENDKTLSVSPQGKYQIQIENRLMNLPRGKWTILRVPMIYGNQSPRLQELRTQIKQGEAIEVFPNLSLNVTYADKLTQQIHYLINRNKKGILHLGSRDLCLHEDFIRSLIDQLGNFHPTLKRVYTTNDIRYSALIAKDRPLPKYLQFEVSDVIRHHHPI